MNQSIFLFVILSMGMILGCGGNSNTAKIDKRVSEVMAIHDEVMPKMDVMVDHENKLKALKVSVTDETELGHLDRQIGQLQESGEMMMSWMRKFSMPSAESGQSFEETMKYLDNEEKRIIIVRNAMNSSLEEAMETVNNYKNK